MRTRYTSIAISLHWLIAILLIGLIAVGKYMNGLEETDRFRFELIQWHKSFGILVLLLVFVRIAWRLTHQPPRLVSEMAVWERFAASATHVLLYVLMLVIPLSGWLMVSASPLNLATELFGAIPWPHLPVEPINTLAGVSKETVAELSAQAHHLLANGLLVLVLLHFAAALKHQFVKKDNLLSRMWISDEHRSHSDVNHALLPGLLLAGAVGLFLWDRTTTDLITSSLDTNVLSDANEEAADTGEASAVAVMDMAGFTAIQMGEPVEGAFNSVSIELVVDSESPESSVLNATVQTASVSTGDGQIDSTVVTADWFASDQYPEATFRSTAFEPVVNTDNYSVSGDLTIRGNTRSVTFILMMADGVASGEFPVDRKDYEVGTGGQDGFIEAEVMIRFSTTVAKTDTR